MRPLIIVLFLLPATMAFSQDPYLLPPDAEAFQQRNFNSINSKYRKVVDIASREVAGRDLSADSITSLLRRDYAVLGNLSNSSLDAITLFVMIQASREDVGRMKGINAELKRKDNRTIPVTETKKQDKKNQALTPEEKQHLEKLKAIEEERLQAEKLHSPEARLEKLVSLRVMMNERISKLLSKVGETEQAIIKSLK